MFTPRVRPSIIKRPKIFEVCALCFACGCIINLFLFILTATEEELTYPNYTANVVKVSIVIFLIYFGILREPNGTDEMLGRGLFEILPELEIPMLESEVKRLESNGIDSTELRRKIEELKSIANLPSEQKN